VSPTLKENPAREELWGKVIRTKLAEARVDDAPGSTPKTKGWYQAAARDGLRPPQKRSWKSDMQLTEYLYIFSCWNERGGLALVFEFDKEHRGRNEA
jgi:hypothetical protein